MSMLSTIRQTARGASVIADWVGGGGHPVPAIQADGRAQACITCPHNKAPLWWESAKGSIATAIRDMLAVKNECEMRVKDEDSLSMCEKCGCCLKLKVWTPIEHVAKAVARETVANLPDYCWMKKELS